MELVFRLVFGFIEMLIAIVRRRSRERDAEAALMADVHRVNAWLRTQGPPRPKMEREP